MKYTKIKDINEKTALVLQNGELKMVQTYRFPAHQNDLFDLFMEGKTMPEAQTLFKENADRKLKELQRLRLADKEAPIRVPEEFEMMKIPGGNGWQIEVLTPVSMTLEKFRTLHTLTEAEEAILADQLTTALTLARQAELIPSLKPSNIFLTAENHFELAEFDGTAWPTAAQAESLFCWPSAYQQFMAGLLAWNANSPADLSVPADDSTSAPQ